MERIICLLIGYGFGLFQTGYIYGALHHVDIRRQGSGNAGTTNALRTMGIAAGAVTFLGDCFKCVLAILLVRALYAKSCAELLPLLSLYAGAGVILGHNYPFYMSFKGGKGIAATAGLILATTSPVMVLIELGIFVLIVAATRYVSLGSLAVVMVYLLEVIWLGQHGCYGMEDACLHELYAVAAALMLLAYWRHRANIKRLISGTENKLSVGKNHKNS